MSSTLGHGVGGHLTAVTLVLAGSFAGPSPAVATEPAQDEALAYATGVQTYINGFPMMDLYRTLWKTSFDPGRGHDRTLNEFFTFDRLVTSADDWVGTPNNDTIFLRAFIDLRNEPVILVIPPMGNRHYWFPVSDMHHDFDANLSWDTVGSNPVEISGYDIGFFDGTGAPLHGDNRFVLRLDPPPPVNAFWSLTLYSAKAGFLAANPINRYSVGDRTPGIVYGEGGELSIFIQHEMPGDPTERANWLPAPDEPYYLIIR